MILSILEKCIKLHFYFLVCRSIRVLMLDHNIVWKSIRSKGEYHIYQHQKNQTSACIVSEGQHISPLKASSSLHSNDGKMMALFINTKDSLDLSEQGQSMSAISGNIFYVTVWVKSAVNWRLWRPWQNIGAGQMPVCALTDTHTWVCRAYSTIRKRNK